MVPETTSATAGRLNTRVMIFGAHPDDTELTAAGLSLRVTASGGVAQHVSVTDGQSGHPTIPPRKLIGIRRSEADAAAAACGATAEHLGYVDGSLQPTLEARRSVIKAIRRFSPDVVVTPRTVDYHPDHRVTAQLVQDSCLLAAEEGILPELPALAQVPVLLYAFDEFTRPVPHRSDLIVDISKVVESKIDALLLHRSQFLEWLSWTDDREDAAPTDHQERVEMTRESLRARFKNEEKFEISEYGSAVEPAALRVLLGV